MDPLLLPSKSSGVKTLSDDDDDDDENNNNGNNNNVDNDDEEDEEEIDFCTPNDEVWTLRVKSLRDVDIRVRPSDTLAAVKQTIRNTLGCELCAHRPYTRLVCKGRLLAPDTAIVAELPLQPYDVLHAVLSAQAPYEGPQAALQRGEMAIAAAAEVEGSHSMGRNRSHRLSTHHGPSRRAWRGAGINAAGLVVRSSNDSESEDDDDDDDSTGDVETATAGYMGLDRLRQAGLRGSDIIALRTYFGRAIDRHVQRQQAMFAHEPDARRRRLLQEEAWMAAQGPLSEFRLNINPMAAAAAATGAAWPASATAATNNNNQNNNNTRGGISPSEALWRTGGLSAAVGNDRDFIWGFLLGFLVGLLMLVWVWMPSVPHKQKLGILTGICFQLAMTMMKTSGGVDDATINGGGGNLNPYPLYDGDDYFFHE